MDTDSDVVAHNRPVLRQSVRVLVIDTRDRVLLFASIDDDGHRFWSTPGGGLEPGESGEQAARRELHEETGLASVELGPELSRWRGIGTWGGVTYAVRERFFLARVPEFRIDTSGFTELERSAIVDARWWTADELAGATDRLVPPNLAALVHHVLSDGAPERPWVLDAWW